MRGLEERVREQLGPIAKNAEAIGGDAKDEEAREPCHTASERDGRVFPMPGAAAESGEWSGETAQSNKVTKPTTSEVLRA